MNIAVLGYGIQGRAQALNLRDSGFNVIVGNINDKYKKVALKDGMVVKSIIDAVRLSEIILILLPDSIQDNIIKLDIIPHVKKNSCIVFAHGYWLAYEAKKLPNIDILMIAPRFPGEQIRNKYLNGSGVPAYVDVVNNVTGKARLRMKKILRGLGFDKGGIIEIPFKMEAELDLMIEQSMAPIFFASVQCVFNELVSRGFPEEVVCMELYYSGELGAVRTMMGRDGLYSAFQKNASPTCQYGIASSLTKVWPRIMNEVVKRQLNRIQSGKFADEMRNLNTLKLVNNFLESKIANKIKLAEKKVQKKIRKI